MKKFLLLFLTFQLSVAPFSLTHATQDHSPSEGGEAVSNADMGLPNVSDSHKNHSQKLTPCDQNHANNGRCASCLCMNVGVLSSWTGFVYISNRIALHNYQEINFDHVYLIPPFRPPISNMVV